MNELIDELEEIRETIKRDGRAEAIFTFADGSKDVRRLAISSYGGLMVMAKGKKRRGYNISDVIRWENVTGVRLRDATKKPESDLWFEAWSKVLARLEKSGLHSDYAENIRTALAVGYDKLQLAYEEYWKDKPDSENAAVIQAIDPLLINIREDGSIYADTSVIWYMNKLPKVKKMYFGKYDNERCLQTIEYHMGNHTDCSVYGRSNYDVSFSYRADKNRAWYSEEYKGCGNGHYYLALDATHAVFYEDD